MNLVGRNYHPRSQFTINEDNQLIALVKKLGTDKWTQISKKMRNRNERQCRERWEKYLSPDVAKEDWSAEEDSVIEQKYLEFGSKWKKIASFLQNRTNVMVRNRWNLLQRKRAKSDKNSQKSKQYINPNNDADFETERNSTRKKSAMLKGKTEDTTDNKLFNDSLDITDKLGVDLWGLDPIIF